MHILPIGLARDVRNLPPRSRGKAIREQRDSPMTYLRRTRKLTAAPKRPKQSRVGKATGTIRLDAVDMSNLRKDAYSEARGFCQMKLVCSGGYVPWKDGHLAHVKSRGAGGSDALTDANGKRQVLWSCAGCHIRSHAYGPSNRKPVPPKMEKNA